MLGVVGQRIDVAELLLDAGDPERWPALGQRAGVADGDDAELALGGAQRDGDQARRRGIDRARDAAVDLDPRRGHLGERLAPDGEHRVGGDQRVAQARAWSR